MPASQTSTGTTANTFEIRRIDLLVRQAEYMLRNLSDLKPNSIAVVTEMIIERKIKRLSFCALDYYGKNCGQLDVSFDWQKHRQMLESSGVLMRVKTKYFDSLAETESVVDTLQEVVEEKGLHIAVYVFTMPGYESELTSRLKGRTERVPRGLSGAEQNYNSKLTPEMNSKMRF